MRIRGGEFSTGTMGNFQPELTEDLSSFPQLLASVGFLVFRARQTVMWKT